MFEQRKSEQYTTFLVAGNVYGIEVTKVQEIVNPIAMTIVPHAPPFVRGLINLRGQVATAIGLREMLGFESNNNALSMNLVAFVKGNLVSFLVDEILDVIEVSKDKYENTPSIIPQNISKFMSAVYKLEDGLLSILDIDKILYHLR
ncbi:MAG: chemotaxis protein CheW [Silvanigrellaceae bacterium]|nr:chemotaxis protein CheW [Silvanigrellaceae bacterium]